MKRILVFEREYGCGAGEIAELAARRLGWHLLDQELTEEIARLARVEPEECARREERLDSWLYRLGKSFWRGSYEKNLSVHGSEIFDADRLTELVEHVVHRAADSGQCVIVGRGAPYFLRNRADTFCVFLYAPRHLKIDRVEHLVGDRSEAEHLVDTVDEERAAFIRHYFGKEWPNRHLYHLMVNTIIGVESTVDLTLRIMASVQTNEATQLEMQ